MMKAVASQYTLCVEAAALKHLLCRNVFHIGLSFQPDHRLIFQQVVPHQTQNGAAQSSTLTGACQLNLQTHQTFPYKVNAHDTHRLLLQKNHQCPKIFAEQLSLCQLLLKLH